MFDSDTLQMVARERVDNVLAMIVFKTRRRRKKKKSQADHQNWRR